MCAYVLNIYFMLIKWDVCTFFRAFTEKFMQWQHER